jgi:hypothetical protein
VERPTRGRNCPKECVPADPRSARRALSSTGATHAPLPRIGSAVRRLRRSEQIQYERPVEPQQILDVRPLDLRGANLILYETEDDLQRVDAALNEMTSAAGRGARTSVEMYEVPLDEEPSK